MTGLIRSLAGRNAVAVRDPSHNAEAEDQGKSAMCGGHSDKEHGPPRPTDNG
jgi:hypothetical protein